uniref:Reverse transcriptase domain-containing protein n=1 Tax=Tanacetum cinerariifolium TaxID=118510 RepID=A0A699GW68_TANCI|nr:reverse transcriptase domain-containing protein [Tanacetum cinerariifolium]
MSAMANTTPLVTTVTKPATNPRDVDATLRVNIQDFCEEYYEDILPIIMDKVRRDKLKEVHARVRSTDLAKPTRRAQPNPDNVGQTPGTILGVEAVPTGWTLQIKIVRRIKNAFVALGNHMMNLTPTPIVPEVKVKRHKPTDENDLTRPWMCEEEDPFTPRIRNFESSRRTRMPDNVKTHDGTGDPKDRVKIFQAAAQVERWAMPTWCHMVNSTLIGAARVWFDELPPESVDSYKDLKAATVQSGNRAMKRAHECMRISGFMHGVNNPELTKCLNEHVPKTMKELMITTTAFIRGEAAAASKKKGKEGDLTGSPPLLTKTPKEILAAETGKFQPPPPMVTPVEKRSSNKFCDFHNDKGHSTDECMQLKKQIEELVRAGKLSHLIKDIKHGRDQSKTGKKEIPSKDRPTAIYMIQSWQRITRQKVTQSFERVRDITFLPLTASSGVEGPLVIEAEMGGHMIHRMYVDGGSSIEILYEHCFNRLRPEIKNQMISATTSLTGFSGETIWPLGQLRILVTIGDADHSTKAWMNFMIVRLLSLYNGIIKRPRIREIQAVPSTAHEMLKFPIDEGIVTIRSTILIPAECTSVITSLEVSKEEGTRPEKFKVSLHPDFPDQEVAIRGTLTAKGHTELCSILKKNLDIFAWQPSDMTGVPRSVAEHRLNIREGYSPVWQKKRGHAPEHAKAIQAEVQKLVEAGIIREVYYHDWLSNPVMDCYPLPEIDWKVKSLCGYPFKCFLDAYKGYHQIQLAELDEEKTTFHTGQGVYCYTKIPFGLKNTGATYQRLVDKAFDNQIGRDKEVYVDKLVVKSYTEAEMLRDVDKRSTLTPEGIKPCPDKTAVVLQLPSPRTIKEVQSLNRKLASLNRFLSKSAEKSLPLFKTLKKCIKKSDFHWTAEAEQAFKQLKQHLLELPLLVAPKPNEELIIHLSATYRAISLVLMTERGATQTPIYFISCALQGPKLNYTPMEKLVMSLAFAAKRLRRTTAKMERHDRRTQYHVPAKNVSERTDPSGFSYRNARRKSASRASGRNSTRFVDTLYGWTIISSNNEAEYEALIAGLRIAAQMGVKNVHVSIDSKLVANQVLGTYVAKEENMINFAHLSKHVLVEILKEKSIKEKEVTTVVEEDGTTWMTPIMEYLKEGTLPSDRKEARKLRIKSRQYELLEGVLYRRSFLMSWLRCVGPLQAEYVIREIHEGSCSMHARPRSMVAKAIRLGYYWPMMHRDACDMIRKCNDCQIHLPVTRNPQQPLTPITAPWPFYKWGIDIAGPFPKGPGKVKFLIVAIDYFTKWIEAKAVATITGSQVKKFVWDNIVCRFIIPAEIGMLTYRTAVVDVVYNDEELRLNLDLLEERRERAAIGEDKFKLKMTKYYNARVRGVTFRLCDFVYRSIDASHAVAGRKLGPKWEGPYEVTEALGDGAYKLRSTDRQFF